VRLGRVPVMRAGGADARRRQCGRYRKGRDGSDRIGAPGCERVADHALNWATEHAPLSRHRMVATRHN
jgi:hypothetical protein